jgi:hypothetical protein
MHVIVLLLLEFMIFSFLKDVIILTLMYLTDRSIFARPLLVH